jgi:hypothetical protein
MFIEDFYLKRLMTSLDYYNWKEKPLIRVLIRLYQSKLEDKILKIMECLNNLARNQLAIF